MALCPGLPGWAGTRKVKSIWILLEQETGVAVASAGSYEADNHASPHHSVFYGLDAVPAAQPTLSKHWRQRSNWTSNHSVRWMCMPHKYNWLWTFVVGQWCLAGMRQRTVLPVRRNSAVWLSDESSGLLQDAKFSHDTRPKCYSHWWSV